MRVEQEMADGSFQQINSIGTLSSSLIQLITIEGGDDANTIDLNAVTAATFPVLTLINVDAGNGHDTFFLAQCVGKSGRVTSIDVQLSAIESTRARLEANGIISRSVYNTTPVTVEYELTDSGKQLNGVLEAMIEWGLQHRQPPPRAIHRCGPGD